MPQDATRLLFGTGGSTDREVSNHAGDPATFVAGLAVRLKSDDTLSLLKADGGLLGVSMGHSLSTTLRVAIARDGDWVPVRINGGINAKGTIAITSYANLLTSTPDTIEVAGVVFTAQSGAATPGTATFRAVTDNATTAASLRTQINAHAVANLLVKAGGSGANVTVTALLPGTAGNALTLAYTDLGGGNVGATVTGSGTLTGGSATASFAVPGAAVYFNNVTGVAEENTEYSTVTGAFYLSGPLTGVYPPMVYGGASTEAPAAYIDMSGGL